MNRPNSTGSVTVKEIDEGVSPVPKPPVVKSPLDPPEVLTTVSTVAPWLLTTTVSTLGRLEDEVLAGTASGIIREPVAAGTT